MEYNTKLQRKKIYEKVIAKLEDPECYEVAMCIMIGRIIFGDYQVDECPAEFNNDYMPELNKQKPARMFSQTKWWHPRSTNRRIKALKAAIALCN